MKRLLFVIHNLSPGGAQKIIVETANGMRKKGYEVFLVTHGHKGDPAFIPRDIEWINLACPHGRSGWLGKCINPFFFLRRYFSLYKTLRNIKPDVVVSFLTTTNILCILVNQLLRYKLIISERSDPEKQATRFPWGWMQKILYCKADIIVANTDAALPKLEQMSGNSPVIHICNSVAIPEFESENKDKIILAVGRLHIDKAYDVLIHAVHHLGEKFLTWKLILVGDGAEEKALKKLSVSLGLEENVIFAGRQSDLISYYKRALIFVLPSRREGLPNVMLEAMSMSLPVVISDASPGPLSLVKDRLNGLVFPVDNVNKLADCISELMDDQELRQKLGKSAKSIVAKNYSTEIVLDKWEMAIKTLCL